MKASTASEFNAKAFAELDTDLNNSRMRKVLQLISEEPVGRLLDIGCGKGEFGSFLITKGWKVSGIDLESRQVSSAYEKGIDARIQDVTLGFPFAHEAFDCVFAGEIIEHLVDTDFFLSEIRRVLRPNGCVVLTTPNLASFENRLRLLLGLYPIWVDYRLVGVGHIRAYTPKVLKQQLAMHGLAPEKHKGNWVPFIPQRFMDDVRYPFLSITGDIFPSFAMDIIIKARKVI
jgi:SAM-dependent methyltransferase